MLMLSRRVQLLLDEDRYRRIEEIARERRVPAAVVIREALDRGLPSPGGRRRAAAERLLGAPDMSVPDLAGLRQELDEIRAGR